MQTLIKSETVISMAVNTLNFFQMLRITENYKFGIIKTYLQVMIWCCEINIQNVFLYSHLVVVISTVNSYLFRAFEELGSLH